MTSTRMMPAALPLLWRPPRRKLCLVLYISTFLLLLLLQCQARPPPPPPSSPGRWGWFGSKTAKVVDPKKGASSAPPPPAAPVAPPAASSSSSSGSRLAFWRKNKEGDEKKDKKKDINGSSESKDKKEKEMTITLPLPTLSTTTTTSDNSNEKKEKKEKKKKKKKDKGGDSPFSFPLSWGRLVDEWQYRVDSLDTYRQVVQGRLDNSLEKFQDRYEKASKDLRKDVDKQLSRASALHEEYMDRIAQQQQRLAELTRSELRIRQQSFNQSLEQFKKQYDDTWGRLYRDTVKKVGPLTKAEILAQQQRLDETFQQFMAQYMNSTTEVRNYIDRMVRFSGDVFPRLSLEEEHVLGLVERLRAEEHKELARLEKPDLRREGLRFEGVVEKLREQQEKLMKQFSAQRLELDGTLKKLMDQLMSFNRLYDDLISRKESTLYAASMNDKVLRRVLECLDQTEADGWEFVTETKGVTVHRKTLPTMDGRLSKFCCVKATGVLDASPADILKLFEDNLRVSEYNKFYAGGRDLEAINENTKVVWAASPPMFFFKARDFCTVVHYRKLQDGTVVVVNRGAEHPDAPRTDKYVRAEILMGANIIQPIPGKPNKAIFTIVTQVDPGGFAPPAIVNKVTSFGPPAFFKEIEAAAKRDFKYPAGQEPTVGVSASASASPSADNVAGLEINSGNGKKKR